MLTDVSGDLPAAISAGAQISRSRPVSTNRSGDIHYLNVNHPEPLIAQYFQFHRLSHLVALEQAHEFDDVGHRLVGLVYLESFAHAKPIARTEFDRMTRYGRSGQQAVLVVWPSGG